MPVAAVGAQRSTHDKEHWRTITPMPIAWGTPDADVITTARKAIPQHQWQTLERVCKDKELVEASKNALTVLEKS